MPLLVILFAKGYNLIKEATSGQTALLVIAIFLTVFAVLKISFKKPTH